MYNFIYNDYDKFVYENELKNFLPDKIIDAHVHLWGADLPDYGSHNGGATWTHAAADEMNAEHFRLSTAVMFPDQEFSALVFGGCLKELKPCNDFLYQEATKLGFPMLMRTSYEMSPDYIEQECKKYGFIGLKPYLSNVPPYIPDAEIRIFDFLPKEHLEVANKHGWIVMLHIARSARLRDPMNLAHLMEIEEKYPNVKLIVAHIGRAYSKQDVGDAFDILGKTNNMYFDFTANVCDDAIKACIEAVGTKRFIFGSDLPIAILRMFRTTDPDTGYYHNHIPRGLYPGAEKDPRNIETDREDVTLMIYEQLRAFRRVATELKLSDSAVEDVMYGNIKRLIDSVEK